MNNELKFSNSLPTEEDLHKMVAKLVVEKAEAMERIHDLLKENTKWKLENQKLNNVLNELEKLTISICENCYEDRETERIKKRINELKESESK